MFRLPSSIALSASIVGFLGCTDPPLEPSSPVVGQNRVASGASGLSAPGGATATGIPETRIDVAWGDKSSNETGFEVHRSTTGAGGVFTLLATTSANVSHYSDQALQLGTYFCYKVRAVRTSGGKTATSDFSNTACAITPPAAPSGLNAVGTSWPRIDLSWTDHATIETGFRILRSTDGENGTFDVAYWASANQLQAADLQVVPGVRYCYRIEAVREYSPPDGGTSHAFVYSAPSNTACAVPPLPTEPPPAAYTVSAKPTSSGSIAVTIRWTDASMPPPSFRSYRSTDGGVVWSPIDLAGGENGEFADAPVPSEQPLCYRVVAYNAAGDAAPSSPACTAAPAAPTNLVATVLDPQTLELSWSDNSAVEDGYEVWVGWYRGSYYCYPPGSGARDAGTWEGEAVVASLGANTTTYRAARFDDSASCDPPTTTWYYVVAKKDGGRSGSSNAVNGDGSGLAP